MRKQALTCFFQTLLIWHQQCMHLVKDQSCVTSQAEKQVKKWLVYFSIVHWTFSMQCNEECLLCFVSPQLIPIPFKRSAWLIADTHQLAHPSTLWNRRPCPKTHNTCSYIGYCIVVHCILFNMYYFVCEQAVSYKYVNSLYSLIR